MGYVRNPRGPDGPTQTELGVLRPAGTEEVPRTVLQPSGGPVEGLGQVVFRGTRRRRMDPRRALALTTPVTVEGRRVLVKPEATPSRLAMARRLGMSPTTFARTPRRRGFRGLADTARRIAERARQRALDEAAARRKAAEDRARAAQAEREAAEAAAIAEAERLAREAVTPPEPVVTDVPPSTMQACVGPPPDRRVSWRCVGGQWRYIPMRPPGNGYQQPWRPPRQEIVNGAPAPQIPTRRPWWLERPRPGDADPAGRAPPPTPPGLPGGPSMRPPPSREVDATERVPVERERADGMGALLPIAAGIGALMLMGG